MKKPIVTKRNRNWIVETSRQRVLEVLFKYPDLEFGLSELAKKAGIAKTHIGKILDEFQSLELVEIKKTRKMWQIRANQSNSNFTKRKIVYNLSLIYQNNLIEVILKKYGIQRAIILFGSFRKGEDISTSDVDIAVDCTDVSIISKLPAHGINNSWETFSVNMKELESLERAINRKIQLHFFNRKNVDINVFNNIANGIVLYGFLEVGK